MDNDCRCYSWCNKCWCSNCTDIIGSYIKCPIIIHLIGNYGAFLIFRCKYQLALLADYKKVNTNQGFISFINAYNGAVSVDILLS